MTKEEINNSMMMNGGNTPEQKADFAWYNYCFEFKDGPYTAIREYKAALRMEIVKELSIKNESEMDKDYHENFNDAFNAGLRKALSLIDTVTPE